MHLTKLELHGFKSFPDRTAFAFDRSVTAILGPNGCGKSNVIDAIKWVLGEGSAKNLRGKEMADVIFAGCATRKPMQAAEVSLYFDNSQKLLPLPYNEICVTRRLNRAGQSEYLINRQPCLRRDIRELFLDTGIGTSAYSIIEQGRVEALLNAKPDERRRVFEEAAGISKYKARRKESLARLGRSQQYLDRVTDIVDEVDKNIRRVSNQAANARRHQRLKRELDVERARHYLRQWRRWTVEIDGVREELARLDELHARAGAGQGDIAQRLATLAGEEITLDQRARVDDETFREAQRHLALVQRERAETNARLESIDREANGAGERIADLRARLERLATEEKDADAALADARAALAQADDAWREREGERAGSAERLLAAEQAVEERRAAVLALTDRRAAAKEELARVEGAADAALQRQADYDRRRDALAVDAQTADEARARLRVELDAIADAIARANDDLARARDKRRAQEEETERRRRDRQQLADQTTARQARRHALADLEKSLSGAFAGVRAILEAKRNNDPDCRDVIGMAVDLMTVPADVAVAVETILGGQAQDLVVPTFHVARAGVGFLKRHRAGRATFLPLDDIRPRARLQAHLARIPGVVGEAVDLVQFDPAHRRAMEYLLAGVLVVENLDIAHTLSRGEARGVRIVTLEGDVVNPSGAVSGGAGRDQRGGLVVRKAEMDALDAELRELAEKSARVDDALQKAAAASEAAAVEAADAEARLARELQRGQPVERDLSVRENDAERLARELAALESERAEHATRAGQTAERRAAAHAEIQQFERDAEEQTRALAAAIEARDTLRQSADGLAEALSDMRVARANLHANVVEGERRLTAARREHDERQTELDGCLGLGARAEFEKSALAQKRASLETAEEEAQQRHDRAEEATLRTRDRLAEIRRALQEGRDEEAELRRRMGEVAAEQHKQRLAEQQWTLRLDNIAHKAREELAVPDLAALAEDLDHRAAVRRHAAAHPEAAAARVDPDAASTSDNENGNGDEPDDAFPVASAWDLAGEALEAEARATPSDETSSDGAAPADDLPVQPELPFALPEKYVGLPVPELPDDLPWLVDVEALIDEEAAGHGRPDQPDDEIDANLRDLAGKIARIGPVNACAIEELAELEARAEFLKSEQDDLRDAVNDLMALIDRLNEESNKRFTETFDTVRANFQEMFNRLFPGGTADLVLERPEEGAVDAGGDPLDAGIDIIARPAGKSAKSISLLSGGEKALCAVALLFAIFQSKPSPFCVLDEVDGPLDETNIDNFMAQVQAFSTNTQFIMITHNKFTMSKMETVYGVTQEEQGVSIKQSLKVRKFVEGDDGTPVEPPPSDDEATPVLVEASVVE